MFVRFSGQATIRDHQNVKSIVFVILFDHCKEGGHASQLMHACVNSFGVFALFLPMVSQHVRNSAQGEQRSWSCFCLFEKRVQGPPAKVGGCPM